MRDNLRVYVSKKEGLNRKSDALTKMFQSDYGITNLEKINSIIVYDVWNLSEDDFNQSCDTVFSEPNTDFIFFDDNKINDCHYAFRVQLIQGQFDQRADSAQQCIYSLTMGKKAHVVTSVIYQLYGDLSKGDIGQIKSALINPVESIEAPLFETNYKDGVKPSVFVKYIDNFTNMSEQELMDLVREYSLTLSTADLMHCQKYFKEKLLREPTLTEIKVLDTYWSDHCRHTTFMTSIVNMTVEDGKYSNIIKDTWLQCKNVKKNLGKTGDLCLMDLATMEMKDQLFHGKLQDKEDTEEINACSLELSVDMDGQDVPYLILFKNETHNHPTEIEPYGGAATCLGGAIRDPLSGRGFVYQSMRITGSADPRIAIEDTWEGKLPQRRITKEAARGFSSYGNQIGLATGHVTEVYDDGFMAKRMEVGAVVGAVPKEQVVREVPKAGDIVLLIGGKTGRDGIGGATGSSKSHNADSLKTSGSEVQKGNPVEERKLQRLFRNPQVSKMIKRSNDFGAGGVSVAIGELADSLDIYLERVPLKYAGLTGMEIALSESQERMAVVIDKKDENKFIELSKKENLIATTVADVTDTGKLRLLWEDKTIFEIDRWFLDTSGVTPSVDAIIEATNSPFASEHHSENRNDKKQELRILDKLENVLSDINVASQKGLVENFDATIGKNTVLMPLGGKNQITPVQGMVAKVPVFSNMDTSIHRVNHLQTYEQKSVNSENMNDNTVKNIHDTNTATAMTFGYDPKIGKISPFHGGYYSVIEAIAKSVAIGSGYDGLRLSMQEYFPRLGEDEKKWGLPIAGLLGAYKAQNDWNIPAIGGKDSMSGTFKQVDVPPTVIAFAIKLMDVSDAISPEFKKADSDIVLYMPIRDDNDLLNTDTLKNDYDEILQHMKNGSVLSAMAIEKGGVLAGISKMAFGNEIGIKLCDDLKNKIEHYHLTMDDVLFGEHYGGLILEVDSNKNIWKDDKKGTRSIFITMGVTTDKSTFEYQDEYRRIKDLMNVWIKPLNDVFPIYSSLTLDSSFTGDEVVNYEKVDFDNILFDGKNVEIDTDFSHHKKTDIIIDMPHIKTNRPKAFIPIFAGTNCEDDTRSSLIKAGADVNMVVFRNANPDEMKESVAEFAKAISESQIIVFSGGFSAGDEPDGSGKFIASVFRHPQLSEALMEHINVKKGLILGICNGFQALIKLGLLPYGKIRALDNNSPTLTYNTIGRHISRISPIRVTSTKSPWFTSLKTGKVYQNVFSHGEGRFFCDINEFHKLRDNGQIVTQYVDIITGKPTMDEKYNINGSSFAIEGICSPNGRVLGKMGHVERVGRNLYKNIPNVEDMKIFENGVNYFKG